MDLETIAKSIMINGKPLSSLRVVDLREELKQRGIKSSGTKIQLQESLILALQAEQAIINTVNPAAELPVPSEVSAQEQQYETQSGDSQAHFTAENIEQKVASVDINEENETIKLTIRSSPKKSEPVIQYQHNVTEADNESSSQSESETDKSSSVPDEDEVSLKLTESTPTSAAGDDSHMSQESSTENQVQEVDTVPPATENEQQFATSNEVPIEADAVDQPHQSDINIHEQESVDLSAPKEEIDKLNQKVSDVEALQIDSSDQVSSQDQAELIQQKSSIKEPLDGDHKSKSLRERLLSHSKSNIEDEASKTQPTQKKRRWGGSTTSESSLLKKGISSDKLRQLIDESTSSSNSSAKVSTAATEAAEAAMVTSSELTNNESEAKEEIKKVDLVNKTAVENNAKKVIHKEDSGEESASAELVSASGSGDVSQQRAISPAKKAPSTVLFITGLVRPYTLPQLKKLLNSTGVIDEDKFWIDKIKSKCYAVYSTVEQAVQTREALHKLKWPQSSPKNLSVEFATLEDVDRCLNPENYEDLPPVKNKTKVEKTIEPEISNGKYDIIQNEPIRDGKPLTKKLTKEESSGSQPLLAHPAPFIREWDRNKVSRAKPNEEEIARKRPRPMSPARENRNKSHERSKSPEKSRRKEEADAVLKESNRKSESPPKSLETLFRKTRALPYIYWLPLTEEQVIAKQKQKAIQEKERLARIAARKEVEDKRPSPPAINRGDVMQRRPELGRDRIRMGPGEFRRRSPPSPPRRKRSPSPAPRRYSRYSRSRSPDRRRFSPRRR